MDTEARWWREGEVEKFQRKSCKWVLRKGKREER